MLRAGREDRAERERAHTASGRGRRGVPNDECSFLLVLTRSCSAAAFFFGAQCMNCFSFLPYTVVVKQEGLLESNPHPSPLYKTHLAAL